MSAAFPPLIDLGVDQVGTVGDELGSGGQAVVYDLPELALPDVPGGLVYKKYIKVGEAPRHGVGRIVAVRSRLLAEPAKLARLDAVTAWPVRRVLDQNGAVCGLVLPRIPKSFFGYVRQPSGKLQNNPMELQFLFIAPDLALRLGTPAPTPEERLAICRDFAAALAFLHDDLNVAFGDISPRNAVFRLGTSPRVMFVDCDAARVVGDVAVPQPYTPDWNPPGGGPSSQTTDVYKLALFVLRCLTPGPRCSTNRDPAWARGALDARGLEMLDSALGGPPDQRPSSEEWHRYLRAVLGDASGPPTVTGVHIDRTMVAAGEPVTLSWSARFADTVEVSGVGIATTSVVGAAGSGTVVLHPARTGTITATARNALAEHSVQTEPVAVFDVPSFQDIAVPMPAFAMPRITPLDLPPICTVLPPFPVSEPVPLPAFLATEPEPLPVFLGRASGDPGTGVPPVPVDLPGAPPEFGFGPSTLPFDVADFFTATPDLGPDLKVYP